MTSRDEPGRPAGAHSTGLSARPAVDEGLAARLPGWLRDVALAACVAFALRFACEPFGDAVVVIVQHRAGSVALSGIEMALFVALAIAATAMVVRRRGAAGAATILATVVAAVVVAWFRPQYEASLRPPPARDFHGVYTPLADWTDFSESREKLRYHVNALGFRGAEFEEHKPPGVVRVALVGDSFIFGMGVADGDTLASRLAERFAGRGLAGRVEVLNLGLCGTNLGTHIAMYERAHRDLGADVVVMGLFVHNDLSEWDQQSELVGMAHAGGFSLLAWLVGDDAAVALATLVRVQHGNLPRYHEALDRLVARLDGLRGEDGAPPLAVLAFHDTDPAVARRFEGMPNVAFLIAPNAPELYIPNDGHPSVAGNRTFADLLVDRLLSMPPLRALTPTAPAPTRPSSPTPSMGEDRSLDPGKAGTGRDGGGR